MSEAAAAKDQKAKGGKSKLPLIIGLVVLLLAGGGGGYWFFVMKPAAEAAAAAAEEAEAEGAEGEHGAKPKKKAKKKGGEEAENAAVKFEPFVVNLADEGGGRYLRFGLTLVIEGTEAEAKHLEETKVKLLRIRSAVIEVLTQQTADHVVTAEGKQELKEAIEKIAAEVLEPVEVTDVLFTEFVVQF